MTQKELDKIAQELAEILGANVTITDERDNGAK